MSASEREVVVYIFATLGLARMLHFEGGKKDQARENNTPEVSLQVHSRIQVCPHSHALPKLDFLSLFSLSLRSNTTYPAA